MEFMKEWVSIRRTVNLVVMVDDTLVTLEPTVPVDPLTILYDLSIPPLLSIVSDDFDVTAIVPDVRGLPIMNVADSIISLSQFAHLIDPLTNAVTTTTTALDVIELDTIADVISDASYSLSSIFRRERRSKSRSSKLQPSTKYQLSVQYNASYKSTVIQTGTKIAGVYADTLEFVYYDLSNRISLSGDEPIVVRDVFDVVVDGGVVVNTTDSLITSTVDTLFLRVSDTFMLPAYTNNFVFKLRVTLPALPGYLPQRLSGVQYKGANANGYGIFFDIDDDDKFLIQIRNPLANGGNNLLAGIRSERPLPIFDGVEHTIAAFYNYDQRKMALAVDGVMTDKSDHSLNAYYPLPADFYDLDDASFGFHIPVSGTIIHDMLVSQYVTTLDPATIVTPYEAFDDRVVFSAISCQTATFTGTPPTYRGGVYVKPHGIPLNLGWIGITAPFTWSGMTAGTFLASPFTISGLVGNTDYDIHIEIYREGVGGADDIVELTHDIQFTTMFTPQSSPTILDSITRLSGYNFEIVFHRPLMGDATDTYSYQPIMWNEYYDAGGNILIVDGSIWKTDVVTLPEFIPANGAVTASVDLGSDWGTIDDDGSTFRTRIRVYIPNTSTIIDNDEFIHSAALTDSMGLYTHVGPPDADYRLDFPTLTVHDDITNSVVDTLTMMNINGSTGVYFNVDADSIRCDANVYTKFTNGIPASLSSYDGDLSLVFHFTSMATSGSIVRLSTRDLSWHAPNSGMRFTIQSGFIQSIVARTNGGDMTHMSHDTDTDPITDVNGNYGDQVYTLGVVYTKSKDYGLGAGPQSEVTTYLNGVKLGSLLSSAIEPINWVDSNNIYVNTFYTYGVNAVTYSRGMYIHKSALTDAEMTLYHTSKPPFSTL
jgi:hypothetical protein